MQGRVFLGNATAAREALTAVALPGKETRPMDSANKLGGLCLHGKHSPLSGVQTDTDAGQASRQETRIMETFVTLGLVLKETRYKESDRILTILTPGWG